jgi:hypothetical protein
MAISGNGRIVAFTSQASNIVTPDALNWVDLFVRDLDTNITTRISSTPTGDPANLGASAGLQDRVGLTFDGRFVVFASGSTDLVPGPDANGFSQDVYLHDRQTGITTRVSVDSNGVQPATGSGSAEACITPDGRFIAFIHYGFDMVVGSQTLSHNVYRRDLLTGTTVLVSTEFNTVASGFHGANQACSDPSISDDGNRIVFTCSANNLVIDPIVSIEHVYVRNMSSGSLWMLDRDPSSGVGNFPALKHPKISGDGQWIAFHSRATNLVGSTSGPGVKANWFRASSGGGAIQLVSKTPLGFPGDNTSNLEVPSGMSQDGQIVAFASRATDLVSGDSNGQSDVFVWGAPPVVGIAAPACGPLAGGTRLRITGDGFTAGGLSVTFGGAAATNLIVLSATALECTTPAGAAGPCNLVISTSVGTETLAGGFTYTADLSVYGAGTPGCDGTQEISGAALPAVGEINFGVLTERAPASSLGLLLIANAQDLAGTDTLGVGVALHVDVFLASELLAFDAVSDSLGRGSCAVPIPNNPALSGSTWYAQTIWAWTSCALPPLGLSGSRGLRIAIP